MFSKSRTRLIAATILTIFVLSFAALAQRKGQEPRNFSLRALDGPAVTDQSLRGEVVVLAFGPSWLPLSRQQLEGIKKFADEYSARGVAVYWVSTDSDSAKSRNYASDAQLRTLADKYKVTVLRDPEAQVSRQFGVDQLPAIVILDKQGNVSTVIGGMDPATNLTEQLAPRLKTIL
jgi:alkyl hydroperoxide reductase subunit AhpC